MCQFTKKTIEQIFKIFGKFLISAYSSGTVWADGPSLISYLYMYTAVICSITENTPSLLHVKMSMPG